MRLILLNLILVLVASNPGAVVAGDSDKALERVAMRSAVSIQIRHNKARKALLNMSRDRVFESYFASDGVAHRNLHAAVLGSRALAMANKLDATTFSLLDGDGRPIVKVVDEEIVNLDHDRPSIPEHALVRSAEGKTSEFTSPIYLSRHLGRWVMAHSRRVATPNGSDSLLHAEFDLESLQKSIRRQSSQKRIQLLAVTADGWVVFDSHEAIPTRRRGSSTDPGDYFDRLNIAGMGLETLLDTIDNGTPLYDGDGTRQEIAIAQAENWYLVAIGTRLQLGERAE